MLVSSVVACKQTTLELTAHHEASDVIGSVFIKAKIQQPIGRGFTSSRVLS